MTRLKFILPIILLALVGCMGGQTHTTPIDRALTYVHQYEALEATYKSQYVVASEKEKKWLSENVAPVLDNMRKALVMYSGLSVTGVDDIDTRLELIRLGRIATQKLAEEFAQ
jgi:hypothetical protein